MNETIFKANRKGIEVSKSTNRHINIFSVVLTMLIALCFISCDRPNSEPQGQQISTNTIMAMNKVKSLKLNTYLTQNYIVFEQSDPSIKAELWQWVSRRQLDISKQEMFLNMDIREVAGTGTSPYIYESYVSGGWEYYTQSSPPIGGTINPWNKYKFDAQDTIAWLDKAQITPQIELLSTPANINLAGTESVNGKECYVLDLTLSAGSAADWVLSQQQTSGPSIGWFRTSLTRSREIYIKAFKNGNCRLWIDKNSYLILKTNINLLFDGVPGNILRSDTGLEVTGQENPNDIGFEHLIRDFNGQWEFSDYNNPVHIQLPKVALNAVERSRQLK